MPERSQIQLLRISNRSGPLTWGGPLGDAIRVNVVSPEEEQSERSLPRRSDSERRFVDGLDTSLGQRKVGGVLDRSSNNQLERRFDCRYSHRGLDLTGGCEQEKRKFPDGDAGGALKGQSQAGPGNSFAFWLSEAR